MTHSAGSRLGGLRLQRPHLTGVIAMAVAAAISVWLIVDHGGGATITTVRIGPATAAQPPTSPGVLTAAQLEESARSAGQPVYWAGPEPGRRYALSRDTGGNVVVRYLRSDATVEDTRPTLTVATIPLPDAFAKTQQLVRQPGAVSRTLVDGGLVYYRADRPATYVAYPGVEYLVEIHDPSPARARQLALDGRIRPA